MLESRKNRRKEAKTLRGYSKNQEESNCGLINAVAQLIFKIFS